MALESLRSVFGDIDTPPTTDIPSSFDNWNQARVSSTPFDSIAIDDFENKKGVIKINSQDRQISGLKDTDWSLLYNSDHTSKEGGSDNLDIHYTTKPGLRSTGLTGQADLREPYLVSRIAENENRFFSWDANSAGYSSRSLPLGRALLDAKRLGKFLMSREGLLFIGKQNLLGATSQVVYRDSEGDVSIGRQRFQELYNPLSTVLSAGGRLIGDSVPNVLLTREEPNLGLFGERGYGKKGVELGTEVLGGTVKHDISRTFESKDPAGRGSLLSQISKAMGALATTAMGGKIQVSSRGDDKMTLAPILDETTDEWKTDISDAFEEEKDGMPFYFKDLRDNNYIIFRAYLEGLSENVMPSWASETYIGRSEPVYIYERAERDIAFTLKLFAQSKDELNMIYKKLNKLTSLCYPQYKEDGNFNNKTRMKPPLVQFRMGELFGNSTKGMLGFIKSISYTYPDESPWETKPVTVEGKIEGERKVQYGRVPKYIMASIGFQVIHEEVPNLDTEFYGIVARQKAMEKEAKEGFNGGSS